jgi:hypothetical protein
MEQWNNFFYNNLRMRFFLPIFTCFIFLLACFFVPHVYAQNANPNEIYNPDIKAAHDAEVAADGQAQKTNTANANILNTSTGNMTWGAYAGLRMIVPICDTAEECKKKAPKTVMGNITNVMVAMYLNPPASGYAYTQDLLANAGIITRPAYAQGIGFAALTPFLPLWKATRNIAYALLILVMIVIGFMIIFRAQLDPKTVISVQAAIPRIILALILITFSYPIVGFMIDLMYLVTAILISVIVNGAGGQIANWNASQFQTQFLNGSIFTLFSAVFGGGLRSLDDFFGSFAGWSLASGGLGAGAVWALPAIATSLPTIIMGSIVGVLAPTIIFAFLLVLGLLFVWVRLLILLINSYIQILIALILGPLILLNEAIPGRTAFKDWILNIVAQLSVFPATCMLLISATYLTSTEGLSKMWAPPFTGFALPGFFNAFLGMCVIFLTPTMVVGFKKLFGAKPALPVSAGTALSPLTGAFQTGMGAMGQFHSAALGMEAIKRIPGLSSLIPSQDRK